MKRLIVYSIAFVLSLSIRVATAQDKLKEGKATFEISYPDAEEMNDQMLAMMPKESVNYFKDGKTRSEVTMGYGTMITIYDPDKKESYLCMDMMGKKTAIKSTDEELEKQRSEMGDYDVKLSDDTKKIAGYVCKKATVTMKKEGDSNSFEVWYTTDLPHNPNSKYAWKGIDGYSMEFTLEQKSMNGNIKMKLVCTKVEKATVTDDMLKVPDGYTVMTADEMKKQWGDAH
jgi:hypothetical protein